jgi:hypothetical protein
MSPARSTALLALAAVFFTAHACEDAERDPPPAGPAGGATAGSGGAAPGASGGSPGTGGRGGAPGQGGAPGGQGGAPGPGAPSVASCPANAPGTPCTGGSGGLPAVCVQPSDGGPVSGCICLQMTWTCGSLPGGGGGGSGGGGGGGALPDAGALVPPMTSPCPPDTANETCPGVGSICSRAGDAGAAGYCACFPDGMGMLRWRCAGQP